MLVNSDMLQLIIGFKVSQHPDLPIHNILELAIAVPQGNQQKTVDQTPLDLYQEFIDKVKHKHSIIATQPIPNKTLREEKARLHAKLDIQLNQNQNQPKPALEARDTNTC